jgi:hypothetical protein
MYMTFQVLKRGIIPYEKSVTPEQLKISFYTTY